MRGETSVPSPASSHSESFPLVKDKRKNERCEENYNYFLLIFPRFASHFQFLIQ